MELRRYFFWPLPKPVFFPVPPDVLLMALALAAPARSYRFALITSVGSVAGGILGYAIGWGFWGAVEPYFYQYVPGVNATGFEHVRMLFEQYGFWTVFAAGFTPIPYKIFTISAGVFQISLPVFIVASLIGRSLRFFLVAATFYYFGNSARNLIENILICFYSSARCYYHCDSLNQALA